MILGILQARTSSSRLPRKVMLPLAGAPMLARQIERLKRAKLIDGLVLATSDRPEDDCVAELAEEAGIASHRGSLDHVLDRFYTAAAPYRPEWIVRVTGDCPLADWDVIDRCIRFAIGGEYDYASNSLRPTWPDGLDVEVCTFAALETAWREADNSLQTEHVMPFITGQPERFRLGSFENEVDLSAFRWTVDELRDYEFVCRVYDRLYSANPAFTTADVLALLTAEPELIQLNLGIERNEGLRRAELALRQGDIMLTNAPRSYLRSEEMLERALKVIPLGAQTFSKSYTQYPRGSAPFFIERAEGSRAWDVDGNEYVDFNNALCSVTLGHVDPDVTAAVSDQLSRGTIFSLSNELEIEVAERIVATVPCAEKVRFGKNGSDATAGALRAARAYTGRERVAVSGYHGWQDWYIGSTARNKGVPVSTRGLTNSFPYNDLAALRALLERHPGEFAAVILEPMNVAWPKEGFLQGVVDLAREHGAVAVFDETITGFRFAPGGAQELFGVTPDLACFGKGLANGYPLAAVAGRSDIMAEFEEVFFSFTMGGETLSLAAAKAAIDKMHRENATATMMALGTRVIEGTQALIDGHGCADFLSVAGHPTWSFLLIADHPNASSFELKTLYLQEMLARGILTVGTHNISFAHSEDDVERLLAVYDEVFPMMRKGLERPGGIVESLRCAPLKPLFKVR